MLESVGTATRRGRCHLRSCGVGVVYGYHGGGDMVIRLHDTNRRLLEAGQEQSAVFRLHATQEAHCRSKALQKQFCAAPEYRQLLSQATSFIIGATRSDLAVRVTVECKYGKSRSVTFLEILPGRLQSWTELAVPHCDLQRHEAGGKEGLVSKRSDLDHQCVLELKC